MFNVGDKVFYPRHGAGIIVEREWSEVSGERREYLRIHIPASRLEVRIPLSSAEKLGLRALVGKEELMRILGKSEQWSPKRDVSWKKRFEENLEIIRQGDFKQMAAAFRELYLHNKEKPLNASEKVLLNDMKQLLIGEICMVIGIDEEGAEKLICS